MIEESQSVPRTRLLGLPESTHAPLPIAEIDAAGLLIDRDEIVYRGFYPRQYNERIDPIRM